MAEVNKQRAIEAVEAAQANIDTAEVLAKIYQATALCRTIHDVILWRDYPEALWNTREDIIGSLSCLIDELDALEAAAEILDGVSTADETRLIPSHKYH